MSESRLKVAVIGLGSFGSNMLDALGACADVEIVGISDRDQALAEKSALAIDVPFYGDNRSLLAETKPQAVFISVPPMSGMDLIAGCVKRGIHVWKDLPLGRNLDESVAMVKLMDGAGLKFAIGTQWRFAPGYSRAAQIASDLEQILVIRGQYMFNWGGELLWRADKSSAGGGSLLELGYHPIDMILSIMGMPDEVYGMSVIARTNPQVSGDIPPRPPHDTDDSAVGMLRYDNSAVASIVTCRTSGPFSGELSIHSPHATICADFDTCVVRGHGGEIIDQFSQSQGVGDVFTQQAKAFVKAVANDEQLYMCSARENLMNQAVIEAMYLSDRTRHVEQPERLLEVHKLDQASCLAFRPPAKARIDIELPQR